MDILVIGLNHKTAAVEIREKVAFDGPKLDEAVTRLKEIPDVKENIVLSTCNRVEIYAGVSDRDRGTENIKNFIAEFHNVQKISLQNSIMFRGAPSIMRFIYMKAKKRSNMPSGSPQASIQW
jgi:glutamyl-tRNA reductase